LQASERLPPAQATELLGGIVRFAPEIPYVVRFLQCVKASADRSQTAAALTQALERLDFGEMSAAQMRDILLLIVDVFPPEELPVFAFSLLNDEAFRAAFDRSSEGWPESLSSLLSPLGALHRWVAQKEPGRRRERQAHERVALGDVRKGALLLLGASPASLLELGEAVRRRLFDAGRLALAASGEADMNERSADALVALFRGLGFRDPAARSAAALRLAAALLHANREKLARAVLRAEVEGSADAREARRWLEALDGLRVGNVAFEQRRRGHGRDSDQSLAADRWHRAWHVPTQRDVLVRLLDASTPEGHAAAVLTLRSHVGSRRRALVPGVAAIVEVRLDQPRAGAERPYLALAWQGPALPSRLERGDLSPEQALRWCNEACLLLSAIAAAGLELPDASPHRFSAGDDRGDRGDRPESRLWLSDLWGVKDQAPSLAQPAHAALARQLCVQILGALDVDIVSPAAASALGSSSSIAEIIEALAGL
jgi:hypothetical protein